MAVTIVHLALPSQNKSAFAGPRRPEHSVGGGILYRSLVDATLSTVDHVHRLPASSDLHFQAKSPGM